MFTKNRALGIMLAVVCLALMPAGARAQIIDFETLPGGADTVDQQFIDSQYTAYGVTFSLLSRTTGLPIGSPRIAKLGPPRTAFEGCFADDTPSPHLGLGQSFLTDGTSIGAPEGDLRIEYSTPVTQASGLILDVDCRIAGNQDCEQWTITAYDDNGNELTQIVVNAPEGEINPQCASPEAGPGDSNASGFVINAGGGMISSIVLRYTGTAQNVGLAFDNFSVAGPPAPLAATAGTASENVCAGDLVALSVVTTGGIPPYEFQWEQETGSGQWLPLATGAGPVLAFDGTTQCRVRVSDQVAEQVTSQPVTISVPVNDPLCEANLLISSGVADQIVRFSFLSQVDQLFVASGSGGLNAPSGLMCGGDGNLYVVSQATDEVLRFDGATGAFMDVFVEAGSGGLDVPVGMGFGPDGDLYVVANGNSSVLRYDSGTGAFLDAFVPPGSGLNSPTGLAFGPDQNLYVCSRNSNKVLRFNGMTGAPLGDFVIASSGGLSRPRGLVFGPDGHLYIGEETNDSVRRYDGSTGAFVDVFVPGGSGGLDHANDVLFGADGRLYVASYNNDRVLAYNGNSGAFEFELDSSLLNGPAWLALSCQPSLSDVQDQALPSLQVTVEPAVPNPFNPRTTVNFTLAHGGYALVEVVNVAGRRMVTLIQEELMAGDHTVTWDGLTTEGLAAPSGVYLVRVQSRGASSGAKVALVR